MLDVALIKHHWGIFWVTVELTVKQRHRPAWRHIVATYCCTCCQTWPGAWLEWCHPFNRLWASQVVPLLLCAPLLYSSTSPMAPSTLERQVLHHVE